jgi:hypothetical protein
MSAQLKGEHVVKYLVAALSLGGVFGSVAVAQTVTPIAPVPRFGPGAPVYERPAPRRRASSHHVVRLGRPGPPGTAMPSGQVGPACMTPLWREGFRTNHVECPLYLRTRPGATEQCTASDAAGRVRSVTVTFLDWDAATGRGTVNCALNSRR